MTISEQYPVGGLASPGNTAAVNMANFGDPILWNTTFQYHFMQYFWPELEVNYEYWPNGEHQGLSQVLLTPGIIFGRFPIGMDSPTRPINLIFGVGYQFAVTPNPGRQKQCGRHRADNLLSRCSVDSARARLENEESTMKISARNQLKGKILEVKKGTTTAHVRVEIAPGKVITSSITNEAVDDLGLKVGGSAIVVIKASSVFIATE